jgi:hypothetical protein
VESGDGREKVAMNGPTRFELEWILPQEPGLMTHVALIDETSVAPHSVRAIGRGADEAEALLDLWMTLLNGAEPAEATAFVAAAYTRRTGREPEVSAG